MKDIYFPIKLLVISAIYLFISSNTYSQNPISHTEITKWPYGKRGAISITYDDGIINQFRIAVPIMNRLNLPGTFFINTGLLPGSTYKGKFIGRPLNEIIEETKTISTNKDNILERASAARFVEVEEADDYFTRAGARLDEGKIEPACKILDEFYRKLVSGELKAKNPESENVDNGINKDVLTWDMVREYAAEGHEFASHLVTHPYVSALDEPNLVYELEKSKEEILNQIGPRYTFSAECPYGSEDDRSMEYAYKAYSALRNRMPENYLLELNRSARATPVNSDYEYVQWQRGIVTATTIDRMKAWADTTAMQDNIWLVLVIHGIDGIGWEPLTSEDVEDYFTYIQSKADNLWVATFGDAARYMKARMKATVNSSIKKGAIYVSLDHSLDKSLYDLPFTLKTYVNPSWKKVNIAQGQSVANVEVKHDGHSAYVIYQATPGKAIIKLSKAK